MDAIDINDIPQEMIPKLTVVKLKTILKTHTELISGNIEMLVARCLALKSKIDHSTATVSLHVDDNNNQTIQDPFIDFELCREITYDILNGSARNVWTDDLRTLIECNFYQLFEYLVTRTQKLEESVMKGSTYKKLKSYLYFVEGHVSNVEVSRGKDYVWVRAKVTASMKKLKYKVLIVFNLAGDVKYAACECPAGPGNIFVRNDDRYIGSVYKKAVYREFTDGTFTTEVKRQRNEKHLGLLGPKIKAEVGDTIEVIYKNMASFDNSISLVNLLEDNRMTNMQKQGVKPGYTAMYRWTVPERSGPGPNEPNCVGSSYMSPVFPKRDLATGLLGPLIVCRKGILDEYGNRKDNVAEEYVIAYVIFVERESHYFNENLKRYAPKRTNVNEGLFQTSIRRYSMNGFSWNNIPYLYMSECDHVVWYTFTHGNVGDHSNHIHGQTFIASTTKKFRNDVSLLLPGAHETLEMLADNPGIWMMHCHIGIHVSRGMFGVYRIFPNKRVHC